MKIEKMLAISAVSCYNNINYGFIRYIGVRALCNKTP